MHTFRLVYFNGRGRAELIRLLFEAAGIKYEDKRIGEEEWSTLKANTPDGHLPILEVDGTMLSQSIAIARYVARQGVGDIMRHFTNMRTDHFKLKNAVKTTPSGSGAAKVMTPLQHLKVHGYSFLDPFYRPRTSKTDTCGKIAGAEGGDESGSDVESESVAADEGAPSTSRGTSKSKSSAKPSAKSSGVQEVLLRFLEKSAESAKQADEKVQAMREASQKPESAAWADWLTVGDPRQPVPPVSGRQFRAGHAVPLGAGPAHAAAAATATAVSTAAAADLVAAATVHHPLCHPSTGPPAAAAAVWHTTTGLLGKNEIEMAKSDRVVDLLLDLQEASRKFFFEKDPDLKEELKAKFVSETAPSYLEKVEKTLEENNGGSGFVIGTSMTWADLACMNAWDYLRGTDKDVTKKFRLISDHDERIRNLPRIALYLKNRPDTPF